MSSMSRARWYPLTAAMGRGFAVFTRRWRICAALLVGVVSTAIGVGGAVAAVPTASSGLILGGGLGLACPDPTARVFQPWGDQANYGFAPDGGFETGSGWVLAGGARVVAGNERFNLHGSADKSSLLLPAGASATSAPMCIGLLSSKMRFVIGGAAGSKVKVQVLYRGVVSSVLGVFDGGTVSSSGVWAPSPQISMLGGVLPLLTASVQFRFTAVSGSAQIDDVYLDPFKVT
jgi:hypothetical protein